MTLEIIERDRDEARKNGDRTTVTVLNDMIAHVRKVETAGKKKILLTEPIIDEALMKYRKILQESIDTCPHEHPNYVIYTTQMKIVAKYCPESLRDADTIRDIVINSLKEANVTPTKKNKGLVMRTVLPALKAHYTEMEVAMPVINQLLED